ncbi:hypothetical protein MLD38_004201 [Melastoma candidum]|uniref:Uncharacterized protein n=1 Tax=Melastoma candidum TaxID=119954 RepID=A0ACB9S5S0_9MYRT|nr:hypothetical protein MLD38_004201 [Melastoma candidum]
MGSPNAEKAAAKVSVLVSTEAPRPMSATAPRGRGWVIIPTTVARNIERSCHALRETPDGTGTNHRMTPVAMEASRGLMAAPCQGWGGGAGAAAAGTGAEAAEAEILAGAKGLGLAPNRAGERVRVLGIGESLRELDGGRMKERKRREGREVATGEKDDARAMDAISLVRRRTVVKTSQEWAVVAVRERGGWWKVEEEEMESDRWDQVLLYWVTDIEIPATWNFPVKYRCFESMTWRIPGGWSGSSFFWGDGREMG